MKQRLRQFFTNPKTLAVIAILIVAALVLLSNNTLKLLGFWLGAILIAALLVIYVQRLIHKKHARKMSDEFDDALNATKADNADMDAIRDRMRDAIKSIKSSRLGEAKGREALYELPWYMIIGNPAAGKSTAIANSGLAFPFAEEHGTIIQGIGGTRNCDWYFTSEGIILDTAGRYSVETENRSEWLGFLDLLRKHRPRAPINGIIVAASIADLTENRPEFIIDLAKKLRNRVQDLTEYLEVIPPIYIVFTKMDLIAGFNDFFSNLDEHERNQVWGATLPFQPEGSDNLVADFDRYFDELSDGLQEMSLAQMSLQRDKQISPAALTLPLEFKEIRSALRTFISTLFEDNPFQFKPVFRGFYFTSALQEPAKLQKASGKISQHFHLAPADKETETSATESRSYFLLDMFRKVIFADKQLVRQYSSKQQRQTRFVALVGTALALSLIMAGWTWSYTNNRQLVANVEADLKSAVAIQQEQVDLSSRLKALLILQDRLQQLKTYRNNHPMMLGLGLYQGKNIEKKLREEYFKGMQQIMLTPVTQNLEAYLEKVVEHHDELGFTEESDSSINKSGTSSEYSAPSPTDTEQAYNALKAYLMLKEPQHVEPVLLAAQLTRFWRSWLVANRGLMSRDELIATTQKLITFYTSEYKEPQWPTIRTQTALVADARSSLQQVISGMSAIKQAYAQINARAANRYAPLTVASILNNEGNTSLLTGSYAIPAAYTYEAWNGYIKKAIRSASNNELSITDWVLQTEQDTDLTLMGSPEQIQKQLVELYKADYVTHWQSFIRGIDVKEFSDFTAAVAGMDELGDIKNSPFKKLLTTIYTQISWDNPSPLAQGLSESSSSATAWFKGLFSKRAPDAVGDSIDNFDLPSATVGAIGKHFVGITHLMQAKESNPALFENYMEMLAELRNNLNQIDSESSPGPGAKQLMEDTLNNEESILSEGLQLVDKELLNRLDSTQRNMLRPLLLRPLIQTFAALVPVAEQDINTSWKAKVYDPFNRSLAGKFPFDSNANMQATQQEISRFFGPTGAIADFIKTDLGRLINQRGDIITPKQWADMGITLTPGILSDFGRWIAPIDEATDDGNKTIFQVRPGVAAGSITSYTIEINGQKLHYRNTPAQWYSFVWSDAESNQIAKVSVDMKNGKKLVLEEFAGSGALARLFQAAKGSTDARGVYHLTWERDNIPVTVQLRIISSPQMHGDGSAKKGLGGKLPSQVVNTAPTQREAK